MLRVDRAPETPLTPAQHARLRRLVMNAARDAQAIVVSDYGSGLINDALVGDLRLLAQRMPVCVDSRYNIRAFKGVTVAKPNEPELEAAVGGRLRGPEDVERAGRSLLASLDVKALVVTRGHHGMSLFTPDAPTLHVPVWGPAEAVDVTGAGDTVLATLSLALAVGATFPEAAKLANIAGGIVVQKPGTATCSRAELLEAIGEGTPKRVTLPRPPKAARSAKRV
jgi:rfaE bifunctional protein kinase chain/domain